MKIINENLLIESNEEPKVYMNTWKNYNEYGADLENSYGIKDGWMSLDDAVEFAEKYADDEPFINDTDNMPFEVGEYDNIEDVAEKVKRYEALDSTEKEAVKAWIDTQSNDIESALDCIESGDYIFLPGVTNEYELGVENVEAIGSGSIIAALGEQVSNYIDRDLVRDSWEWDIDEILREEAEDFVDSKYPEIEYDSNEYNDKVEEYIEEVRDKRMDELTDNEIAQAENGGMDDDWYDRYFDYEAYGRDLTFGDWSIADNGAICVF